MLTDENKKYMKADEYVVSDKRKSLDEEGVAGQIWHLDGGFTLWYKYLLTMEEDESPNRLCGTTAYDVAYPHRENQEVVHLCSYDRAIYRDDLTHELMCSGTIKEVPIQMTLYTFQHVTHEHLFRRQLIMMTMTTLSDSRYPFID